MSDITVSAARLEDIEPFVASVVGLFQEDGGTHDPFLDTEWPVRGGRATTPAWWAIRPVSSRSPAMAIASSATWSASWSDPTRYGWPASLCWRACGCSRTLAGQAW